ncbi:Homogentisate phytyltransferase 1, chloroplastic [Sesamum angolense]|uniref:Homogentisate phytyltransferase 1, chloroplastic n=1 Tax=Sesamum angolense TaxID=2727404 RepID=A0AAE1WFP8_9LAMI|nr:Homogentisate phytyltransferase 1, chloroplastic [Sesamum angolense]
MESLLSGSFHRPLSPLSVPFTAELCSSPSGSYVAAHVLRCKAFKNVQRLYAERLQEQRQNLMLQHVKRSIITLNPRKHLKYIVSSASGHSLESEPPKTPWRSVQQAVDAFYRFSRPHTVIGTENLRFYFHEQALSIISVSLLAVEKLSDFSPVFVTGVLEVNKPYLPLASGEYSVATGVMVVSSFAIMSFWLGWVVGSWPLFWALFISFVLGTAYSINVPLLRWKRFAVVAAMCILAVRAVIVQIAFYLHIQMYVYGRPALLTKPVMFATAFMSFFSVVIALFKVFWICILLLEMAYAVALLVGATTSCIWSKWTTVIGHAVLGSLLWTHAKSIDFKNKASITSFYMFIWKLFYAEYLLIPLVR